VRFVEETVAERERVSVTVVDLLREGDRERVTLPVRLRVKGLLVATGVRLTVIEVERLGT
jgi:hypothetical protein